ncbi:MAG: SixA phosphatase family protein [Acidimicrobiales bacterium]
MPLFLVRHAHAGRRKNWDGPDRLRPLSRRGRRQAAGLVEVVELHSDRGVARVLSSPYVRCAQTVESLAARSGLVVEEVAELAEGASTPDTVALLRRLVDTTAVACTHGDVVPAVLDAFACEDGLVLPDDYPYAKGSTWELEAEGGRFVRARYFPPPA